MWSSMMKWTFSSKERPLFLSTGYKEDITTMLDDVSHSKANLSAVKNLSHSTGMFVSIALHHYKSGADSLIHLFVCCVVLCLASRPDWLLYTVPASAFLVGIVLFLYICKTQRRRNSKCKHTQIHRHTDTEKYSTHTHFMLTDYWYIVVYRFTVWWS